jgi:hypothetical protein
MKHTWLTIGRKLGVTVALGALAVSGGMAQTTLVATGSVWKYLSDGSNQGAAWRTLDYDDAAWPSGPAELGFGDGDEVTVIGHATNGFVTFYFRHAFILGENDRVGISNLLVALKRDDGAVVHLNGTEVRRSHLPPGTLDYLTLAPTAVPDDGGSIFSSAVDPALLVSGTNLLAVEIHQSATTSSDVSFDLALVANTGAPLIPIGARWRYLDDSGEPPTNWFGLSFDGTTWSEGLAELGFDDGDEATALSRTNSLGATNLAFYFRHQFNVSAPAACSNLVLRVLRDDGALAYLNGVEVFRNNMPTGAVSAATMASSVVEDTTRHAVQVDPALLRPGENVMAVEIHQAVATSSDVSFDLELVPNVPPSPPELVLTGLTNGVSYLEPAQISVEARVSDLDDAVERVEFYLGTNLLASRVPDIYDSSASLTSSNLLAGDYAFSAIAVDSSGLRSTSGPIYFSVQSPPSVLVAAGSEWKYLDTGVNAETAWREPAYGDSDWATGAAPLGFGDSWLTTAIRSNRTDNSRIMTYYFRRQFALRHAERFTNLLFRVLRDDGAVAYLNGTEIFRMNMSGTATIYYTNRASLTVGGANESTYFPTNINPAAFTPGLLVEGPNLLAVEVHQDSLTSSDLGFDLELVGIGSPAPIEARLDIERLELDGVTTVRLTWELPGAVLEQAPSATGSWDAVPGNPAGAYEVPATNAASFYRLRP